MDLIVFLIIFPLIPALILLLTNNEKLRGITVRVSVCIIALVAVLLTVQYFNSIPLYYLVNSELVNSVMILVEVILSAYIIYIGIKNKRYFLSLLSFVQAIAVIWFDIVGGSDIAINHHFFVDKLTIVMVLIVAIIGGLICIYAVSYMRDYHQHHKDVKDRRKMFFSILFLFLSAMFGIIFSNNFTWMYLFWEITTVSSFLLIGYTQTKEAVNNSFTALFMNVIGGLCFALAIVYLGLQFGVTELSELWIINAQDANLTMVAILLAVAGLSKAAQLPFSKWLLGAMVAPTPTSALLHSSTMVKAGVYLLLRLSPLFGQNIAGTMVVSIGGLSFLIMSLIAISQSDAKKVLAYSTIANLGLIVACAGEGNVEAIWAAVMLIIFHSVSKSLMFLSVGATEHMLGSRDIEDMHGLIVRIPEMAILMAIGICGMFLAPFGMLISKWAALRAFVDYGNVLIFVFLVYGSAATLFYWTKWLGKITAVMPKSERIECTIKNDEGVSLYTHAFLVIGLCVLFPVVSKYFINPLLFEMFGVRSVNLITEGNQLIMMTMLLLIAIIPFGMHYFTTRNEKVVTSYMGGINEGDNKHFTGSIGGTKKMYLASWYMESYFGEKKLLPVGLLISLIIIVTIFALAIGGLM